MRVFILLVTAVIGLLGIFSESNQVRSCRDLAEPVWYAPWGEGGAHDPGLENVVLWRMDTESEKLVLTAQVDSQSHYRAYPPLEFFSTSDYGKSWVRGRSALSAPPATSNLRSSSYIQAPGDAQVLYRHLADVGLNLVSTNGGRTWSLPNHSIEGLSTERFAAKVGGDGEGYHTRFGIIAIHPHSPLTVYATVDVVPWKYSEPGKEWDVLERIYLSRDGGESWSRFAERMRYRTALGISPSNADLMYAVGVEGLVKTTDGGKHWHPVTQQRELEARPRSRLDKSPDGKPNETLAVRFEAHEIVFDSKNENIVYVVSNKGIYRTLDGGNKWCLLNLGFDEIDGVTSLLLNPSDPRELFVGSRYGVFHSKDRGCSFVKLPSPTAFQTSSR